MKKYKLFYSDGKSKCKEDKMGEFVKLEDYEAMEGLMKKERAKATNGRSRCRKYTRRNRELRDEIRERKVVFDEGLVDLYEEYSSLLASELSEVTPIAYLHGWRSSNYSKGAVLKAKISKFKTIS